MRRNRKQNKELFINGKLPSSGPTDYFERICYNLGYQKVAGVDEVGRGTLAGPVVSAAVILPKEGIGESLFDSKKISEKKRESLYEHILSRALGIGIGWVDSEEIDQINIFNATLKAMYLAIKNLPIPPDFVLIDGNQYLHLNLPQRFIPKGDQLSNSIAAASIVAKVTRDRMMFECHKIYPQYNFAKHKGYGTKEHKEAIQRYGICEIHRKTFRGVKEYL